MNWPTGVGGTRQRGRRRLWSRQTPGSIGYVELIYALQNKISYGSVQNMAGEFVKATVAVGDGGRGAGGAADAAGFPRVDHERAGQGRVSDLVLHLAAAL